MQSLPEPLTLKAAVEQAIANAVDYTNARLYGPAALLRH